MASVTPVDAAADRVDGRRQQPHDDADRDDYTANCDKYVGARYKQADDEQNYSEDDHSLIIFDASWITDDYCRPITATRRPSTWRVRTAIPAAVYL